MATYSKELLSGSVDGQGVVLSQSATPGNIIHTAITGSTGFDELWLYATNTSSTTQTISLEYGNTVSTGNISLDIAGDAGLVLLIPGLPINNGSIVRAFSSSTNDITVYGFVNRIS